MARRKTANICINLVPSLSHFELLQYDITKGAFVRMDSEAFMFDPASRELLDEEERLKTVIKRLYDRNKIPLKAPSTLVIPSFFTRQYTLPEDVLTEDLKGILGAEVERFYVFKKSDPEIGYCSLKSGEILYTAYPKQPLDIIKNAFLELKIPLVSIDCNYTASLRGLIAMGVVQNEVANQLKWGMMIISDFNIFMAVIDGSAIEKIQESPLSLQNLEEESLISEIRGDFNQFFGFELLSQVVIINNSQKLYSTTLVEGMQYQGATHVFDQNESTLASRGAANPPFPCSLESVGGALVNVIPEVPTLELGDPDILKNKLDEERSNKVALVMIAAGIVLYAVQFGLGLIFDPFIKQQEQSAAQLQQEINNALNSLSIVPVVKAKLFVKEGTEQNYRASNFVIKLGQALPPDAWLKRVAVRSSPDFKRFEVIVSGGAMASEPLNSYVQELNTVVGTPPLTPRVIPQQMENQRFFEYILENTSTSDPNQATAAGPQP